MSSQTPGPRLRARPWGRGAGQWGRHEPSSSIERYPGAAYLNFKIPHIWVIGALMVNRGTFAGCTPEALKMVGSRNRVGIFRKGPERDYETALG